MLGHVGLKLMDTIGWLYHTIFKQNKWNYAAVVYAEGTAGEQHNHTIHHM